MNVAVSDDSDEGDDEDDDDGDNVYGDKKAKSNFKMFLLMQALEGKKKSKAEKKQTTSLKDIITEKLVKAQAQINLKTFWRF
mgnify:CR=1 FL=1